MNAERLITHYQNIADAPDAIVQLRRFILDLAVRGKLVPQDAKDEPASELLKRIVTEKARFTEAGKKQRAVIEPLTRDANRPFDLPASWAWARLGEVAQYGSSVKVNSNKDISDVTWVLDLEDIEKDSSRLVERVRSSGRSFQSAKTVFRRGDVLFGKLRPYLNKVLVADEDGVCTSEIVPIRRYCELVPEYVRLVLKSPLTMVRVDRLMYGMKMPRLGTGDAVALALPLPPLAEQERVVAKVNELMVLCDQLEAARADREATRDRLTAASLTRLTAPDSKTFHADVRLALGALKAISTRPDQIKLLRHTILNLAVRGMLVLQDPNDEPASELLKRIATQRSGLLKSGYPNAIEARTQLKKQNEQALPAKLAPLPTGWKWATLQQCALIVIDCKNKTAPYTPYGIRLLRTTNVRDGELNWVDQKFVSQQTYALWSQRSKPEPGDILITREAPMGEVAIIPEGEQVCLGQRMMLIRVVRETIDVRFMLYSLRDPNLLDRVQDKPIGMTVQHLRVGGVETLLVPLPPVQEQRRIVAKVDELIGLCNALEARLVTADDTRRRLLDALLAETTAPGEPPMVAVA